MKSKKAVALILCVSMLIASYVVPSYATNGTIAGTPAIINIAEEITGIVVNYFAKLINKIAGTDDTNIHSATVNPHSWIEYDGKPIENPCVLGRRNKNGNSRKPCSQRKLYISMV